MTKTQGHSAAYHGLRGHSIGKHYPYGVTYVGNPHDDTGRWVVTHIPSAQVVTACGFPMSVGHDYLHYAYAVLDVVSQQPDPAPLVPLEKAMEHMLW